MKKSIYMLLGAVILNFMTGCTANTTTSDRLNNQTSHVDQIIQQQAENQKHKNRIKLRKATLYVYQESLIHMWTDHTHIVHLEMP